MYNYDTFVWSYDHFVRHNLKPPPNFARTVGRCTDGFRFFDSHSTWACVKKKPSTSANTRSVSILRYCSRGISARSERPRGSARHNRYTQHNRRQPRTDLANSRPQGSGLRLGGHCKWVKITLKIDGSLDLASGLFNEFVPWARVGFAFNHFMVARRGCCCMIELFPLLPLTHRGIELVQG